LSIKILWLSGNGKRHRTPTPQGLRKIKRISFEAFLALKGLFKDFRQNSEKVLSGSNSLSLRAPTINDLKTKIHSTVCKKNNIAMQEYEPSRINNTRNSSFWQWRRVAEWQRYINDPVENIRGT